MRYKNLVRYNKLKNCDCEHSYEDKMFMDYMQRGGQHLGIPKHQEGDENAVQLPEVTYNTTNKATDSYNKYRDSLALYNEQKRLFDISEKEIGNTETYEEFSERNFNIEKEKPGRLPDFSDYGRYKKDSIKPVLWGLTYDSSATGRPNKVYPIYKKPEYVRKPAQGISLDPKGVNLDFETPLPQAPEIDLDALEYKALFGNQEGKIPYDLSTTKARNPDNSNKQTRLEYRQNNLNPMGKPYPETRPEVVDYYRKKGLVNKNYEYQQGGSYSAKRDSILQANKDVPFIKRVLDPSLNEGKSIVLEGQQEPSSHFMTVSSDDNGHYVHPTVFDTGKDKFEYISNDDFKAFDRAKKDNNTVRFDNIEDAIEFSKNYKTEAFNNYKFQEGGKKDLDLKKETALKIPSVESEVTPQERQILDYIGQFESAGGDYDILYSGYKGKTKKDLTKMTVDEVLSLQDKMKSSGSSAVGAHQFIQKSLKDELKKAKIQGNTLFTPELQDKLMLNRLKRKRGLGKFLSGELSTKDFSKSLSKEFASLPNPETGRSYYDKDGLNKSLTSVDDMTSNLNKIAGKQSILQKKYPNISKEDLYNINKVLGTDPNYIKRVYGVTKSAPGRGFVPTNMRPSDNEKTQEVVKDEVQKSNARQRLLMKQQETKFLSELSDLSTVERVKKVENKQQQQQQQAPSPTLQYQPNNIDISISQPSMQVGGMSYDPNKPVSVFNMPPKEENALLVRPNGMSPEEFVKANSIQKDQEYTPRTTKNYDKLRRI
jgi:muramidase (phage lysozyme)